MRIVNAKPPIWEQVRAQFPFNEKVTIFCWGDTIYNPGGIRVGDDLVAHESVHMRQQKDMEILGPLGVVVRDGTRAWWKKYLADPQFRLEQEIEAFRAQYQYVCQFFSDKNQRFNYARTLANQLSGPMYGDVGIGSMQAYHRITTQ